MPRLIDALNAEAWSFPHTVIAVGKGGVGKTTISLRLGVELARAGRRVLVASLDPAAHLLGYLGLGKPMAEVEVAPRLRAVQYTIDSVASRVAEEYANLLRRLLPGLNALGSMGDVVRAVRESPGFEEEVFLRLLAGLYERRDVEVVVVDTPPTGVALRVLRLPRLYLFWLRQLKALRERIVATRYAIARAMGKVVELDKSDPVLARLASMEERFSRLWGELRDPARTSLVIVATPEPLPVYEAQTVVEASKDVGVRVELIVANRVLGDKARELGVGGVEEEALSRLKQLRCKTRPPAGFAAVAHAEKPPSSLRDVERLDGYIEVVARAGQPC